MTTQTPHKTEPRHRTDSRRRVRLRYRIEPGSRTALRLTAEPQSGRRRAPAFAMAMLFYAIIMLILGLVHLIQVGDVTWMLVIGALLGSLAVFRIYLR